MLRKPAEDAAEHLGERVTEPVITVPYVNDARRRTRKDARRIAWFEVLRIINEPTAALAYGLDDRDEETVLVVDLGGGTFDVPLLDVGDGLVELRFTSGDGHLGGGDFDKRVVDRLTDEFRTSQGIDLRQRRAASPLAGRPARARRAGLHPHRRRRAGVRRRRRRPARHPGDQPSGGLRRRRRPQRLGDARRVGRRRGRDRRPAGAPAPRRKRPSGPRVLPGPASVSARAA